MGTPSTTPLQYVLAGYQVTASELSPQDWLFIIKKVMALVKECMESASLGGFGTIDAYLNCMTGNYQYRETNIALVKFHDGIDSSTRFACAADLEREYTETRPDSCARWAWGKDLWFTQKGELILWTYKYSLESRSGYGYRQHHTASIDLTEAGEVSKVSDEQFLALLSGNYEKLYGAGFCLGKKILMFLIELLDRGGKAKKAALDEVESALNAAEGILSRIV